MARRYILSRRISAITDKNKHLAPVTELRRENLSRRLLSLDLLLIKRR